MNTKIRTIIIGIAASASIGVAPVAPVVTQAATNQGSQKLHDQICENLGQFFDEDVNNADTLYQKEGNSQAFKDELALAKSVLTAAQNSGCDWAARVRLSLPSSGVVAPITGITSTPPATTTPPVVVKVVRPVASVG